MTELHRAVRRYAHDGKLIDLLGGLHAAIDRLDALLERYAPGDPDAAAGSPVAHAPPSPAGSHAWADALLGAIAIRDHLARALVAAAAGVAPETGSLGSAPESSRMAREQESLLR